MSSEKADREMRPDDTEHGPPARMAPADQAGAPPLLLDQVFDGGSLYQLRASVAAHGGSAGLSQQRTDDLVVAVHELAANVVQHGSGRGRLVMWQHDDELLCRITDEGPSETPCSSGESSPEPAGAVVPGLTSDAGARREGIAQKRPHRGVPGGRPPGLTEKDRGESSLGTVFGWCASLPTGSACSQARTASPRRSRSA